MEETKQGRVLGLDYGTRRIGVAMSDPLRILATAYGAVENNRLFVNRLKDIVNEEHISMVVVGMPLSLKGEKTGKAKEAEEFAERLRENLSVDVVFWDERFTTNIARQTMLTMGAKKKQRRDRSGKIDAMAAAVMLQGFLDSTKKSMSC